MFIFKGFQGLENFYIKFKHFPDFSRICTNPDRVINRWNQLDQQAVGASSINVFKGRLSRIRETRMGFFMD